LRKKILVKAPVLTRTGYGEHGRFVLRALRTREDLFDIYIIPMPWGQSGWITSNDEEREWIDKIINKTAIFGKQGGQVDISVQVTIPNEWELMAPINIGITAGIETTKVSPEWLEKTNMMDKVITISEHSKAGFVNTTYKKKNEETGAEKTLKCDVPVEISHYPVKKFDDILGLQLNLDYDFNYLTVAQDGPRKNLDNTIKWFVEENIDHKVGLVVKTFIKNNSVIDRTYVENKIKGILSEYPERECKIYLLHGEMTDKEMHSLYLHPQIKCLVSLTHGEGYGLPLFEAAYSGLPIIATAWSGQCDFLYAPNDSKKKNKRKPCFAEVDFEIRHIHPEALWPGVIVQDSMWAYPLEGSYKMRLRHVRKKHDKCLEKASYLKDWIHKEFGYDDMHNRLLNYIVDIDEADRQKEWMKDIGEAAMEEL